MVCSGIYIWKIVQELGPRDGASERKNLLNFDGSIGRCS